MELRKVKYFVLGTELSETVEADTIMEDGAFTQLWLEDSIVFAIPTHTVKFIKEVK